MAARLDGGVSRRLRQRALVRASDMCVVVVVRHAPTQALDRAASGPADFDIKPEHDDEAEGDGPQGPASQTPSDPQDTSGTDEFVQQADAATLLRYAAQLAVMPEAQALQGLQGYQQAPVQETLQLAALWRTVCVTMAEIVDMQQGTTVLGDDSSQVADALRKRCVEDESTVFMAVA